MLLHQMYLCWIDFFILHWTEDSFESRIHFLGNCLAEKLLLLLVLQMPQLPNLGILRIGWSLLNRRHYQWQRIGCPNFNLGILRIGLLLKQGICFSVKISKRGRGDDFEKLFRTLNTTLMIGKLSLKDPWVKNKIPAFFAPS